MKEGAAESVETPMERYETKLVGAARSDARQEAPAWTDASPSLCCLSCVYVNTHEFHGLQKPPSTFESCSMDVTATGLQHCNSQPDGSPGASSCI